MYPSVAVLACEGLQTKTIVDLLLENCNVEVSEDSSIWKIDTKYYNAKVNICAVELNGELSEDFKDCVEAAVIYFDSNQENGLDNIRLWQSFLDETQPDIKLLVAGTCNADTKVPKANAIEWCLKNGFELIELNPTTDEDRTEDDDEIIKETKGIERIVEALETHLWTNMKIKESTTTNSNRGATEPDKNSIDTMLDNLFLDENAMEFSNLFERLHSLKESMQSIPGQERKQCAEQIVTAFWEAIGGDDEELGDL